MVVIIYSMKESNMLHYAAIFLIIAIAAFIIGFLGHLLVGTVVFIAKISFFIFLGLFVIFLGLDIYRKKNGKSK